MPTINWTVIGSVCVICFTVAVCVEAYFDHKEKLANINLLED